MDRDLLYRYAKLVAEKGINVQKGQPVMIDCTTECFEFARLLTRAAYEAGASEVFYNWSDDGCDREYYLHADDHAIDTCYDWDAEKYNSLSRAGVGFISVAASNPEKLKGVDPKRLQRHSIAVKERKKEFFSRTMSGRCPWCVVSVPVPAWAGKVFPDLDENSAMERLWREIFNAVRVRRGADPIDEWNRHCATLSSRAEILNRYNFKSLHYSNSLGTDLNVELPEGHVWMAGGEKTPDGVEFIPNMPTEEVFTAPKRHGVNGVVYSSKPLRLSGNIIEGIRFVLKNGRIVDMSADTCEDILRASVLTDEGSQFLGEVALVPHDSPISNSGVLFFNTLFDENASCHFAYGRAYPSCVKGGENASADELAALDINHESNEHVDFMIGTADLSIIGTTHDGDKVTVFKDGNFAF